jgi:hypothetical protein
MPKMHASQDAQSTAPAVFGSLSSTSPGMRSVRIHGRLVTGNHIILRKIFPDGIIFIIMRLFALHQILGGKLRLPDLLRVFGQPSSDLLPV